MQHYLIHICASVTFHNKRDDILSYFKVLYHRIDLFWDVLYDLLNGKNSSVNLFCARYYKQFKLHRYAAERFMKLMDSQFMAHRLTDISEQTA